MKLRWLKGKPGFLSTLQMQADDTVGWTDVPVVEETQLMNDIDRAIHIYDGGDVFATDILIRARAEILRLNKERGK